MNKIQGGKMNLIFINSISKNFNSKKSLYDIWTMTI